MNQRNSHPIRDFIGGLLLVITLHSLFMAFMLGVIGAVSTGLRGDIWLFMLVGIGLSQWLYLGPAIGYFQLKRRCPPGGRRPSEVVKGLLLGALLTILLNGSCFFVMMPIGSAQLQVLAALLLSLGACLGIGFYCLRRRS
jgi:hypothetical protein